MPPGIRIKGAPLSVAPFLFALLAGSTALAGGPTAATDTSCGHTRIDARARVVYVYDGDTVKLQDGRRVRIIGINTPEIGHRGTASEPLATAARRALEEELDGGGHAVLLQYGQERHDHYGRLLAHVFLANGSNVAVPLLQQGLATTLVIAPNTWAERCYQKLEQQARKTRTGLWRLPGYQPRDSRLLTRNSRGFAIVRGRVSGVRRSRYSTWIELPGLLTLHIRNRDRANFPPRLFDSLPGRQIETRGWLRAAGKHLQMNVLHPAALQVLTE